MLLVVPALAYDHQITIYNSNIVTEAQVRSTIEITEVLCGRELNGPLKVIFYYRLFIDYGNYVQELCGCTDCRKPYSIIISEYRYPIYKLGLLAHEIAHILRPHWSEEQILCIEYQFRALRP